MKAIVLHEPGGHEKLTLEERPVPVPEKGWVLVKVRAFGLNRSELMTRKGYSPDVTFPRILGIECVGEIEQDESGEWAKGQQVLAFMGEMGRLYDGSYAEYTALPKSIVYPIESHLPWDVLGAIPEMYQTVHGSLFDALDIQKAETILIRGGTSSIGLLAAQVAKHHGLKVIATSRKESSRKLLLENGAHEVLIDDGHLADKITSKADKVLELVGTPTLKDSLHCARRGGTVCMTGMLSESWSLQAFAPMEFIPPAVRLTVYDSGTIRSPRAAFQEFIRLVEKKAYQLPIGKVFTLEETPQAHALMESNGAGGKIVVVT